MRVLRLWSNTDWTTIWKNLHEAPAPETSKVKRHSCIHGVVTTHDRLHRIQTVSTNLCGICNNTDTFLHRLTECGEGPTMWEWTRWRLAIIHRTDPKYIPTEWLLRPTLKMWPSQRHRAVLWTLTNFVVYRLHQRRTLTPQDYLDFLRRAKWNTYNTKNRKSIVGDYLRVIITDPTTHGGKPKEPYVYETQSDGTTIATATDNTCAIRNGTSR